MRTKKIDDLLAKINGSEQLDSRVAAKAVEYALLKQPPTEIRGFFGQFRFLSNFHFVKVEWQGIVFPTTEHAYQAAKSADPKIWKFFASLDGPREARRLGQEIELHPEWHSRIKFEVMLELTRKKYADNPLRTMLLDTGSAYLEETNHWGDVCWGVCNGIGENMLGHTLMMVREELQNMEDRSAGQ